MGRPCPRCAAGRPIPLRCSAFASQSPLRSPEEVNRIIGSGLIDAYARALAAEQEARDRADLARLAQRFRISLPSEHQPLPAAPVQAELF
ncbi:hypothetical protein [Acetobacter cerevisiae]|uniref:hypothetical protein n=1 Tax=Acetobacter cerevisiae TaxID=178900 RepID=UPI0007837CF2|nr:hypothetical protein [Acetobacter cerevisiae]